MEEIADSQTGKEGSDQINEEKMKILVMAIFLLLMGCNLSGDPRKVIVDEKIFIAGGAFRSGNAHFVFFPQKKLVVHNAYGRQTVWLPSKQWDTLKVGQSIELNYPIW